MTLQQIRDFALTRPNQVFDLDEQCGCLVHHMTGRCVTMTHAGREPLPDEFVCFQSTLLNATENTKYTGGQLAESLTFIIEGGSPIDAAHNLEAAHANA